MKSALERALERFDDGEEVQTFTDEQKEQLAEIDRIYEAKIAKAKLDAQQRLAVAEHPAAQQQIRDDLNVEVRSYSEKRDREKEKLRKAFGQDL
jgi:hypothetical protein